MNPAERATDLGDLADSGRYIAPLAIDGASPALLLEQLRMMLRIRRVEEKIGDMVSAGKIACPCHLGIGQEAIAVGVSENLRASDRVFGGHRSHAHFLALGGEVYPLLAEILGRQDGCSHGMGGSMHLYGAAHGFAGSVPIVAGTVPLAAGAALAAKKDGKGGVAVAYFGDGAAEEGGVHEAMNLAAVWKLPLLFVCENNLFASHLHISLRQPSDSVGRYAEAHRIPVEVVDGNDVVAVAAATRKLVENMRPGGGPAFLEAVTYRWRGHVGPREDNDVGVNRGSDLVLWKGRDPVRRLVDALMAAAMLDNAAYRAMDDAERCAVESAWARAEAAPFPPASALLDRVYAEGCRP
jgi:TPP-dependent pyruvate/acetoin dehydrogenase alpha subunit